MGNIHTKSKAMFKSPYWPKMHLKAEKWHKNACFEGVRWRNGS